MTPRAQLAALEKALREAQEAIDQAVADGAAARDIRRLRAELEEIRKQLERMRRVVRNMIPALLMATLAAEMEYFAKLAKRPVAIPWVNRIAAEMATDTADDAANEITACILRVEELNDKLKYTQMAYQGLERGQPPVTVGGEIIQTLTEEGALHVTYRNGAKVPIGQYTTMVSRTAQARLVGRSAIAYAEHTGEGVVQMSFHLPTCSICAPRQGRYYRIMDFPTDDERQALPHISMAFPSWPEYETVHPNCLHRIYPIMWSMLPSERRREALEGASKPFDDDPQTMAQIRAYNDEQAHKARRREDLRQYMRYKAVLGEEAPKSFAAFRRMKRANSEKYQFMRLDYRRQQALRNDPSLALPNAISATASSYKFTKYFFNPQNADGWDKGVAFESRLGYNIDNWETMRDQIIERAPLYPAEPQYTTQYGTRYQQLIVLYGLKGRPANVVVGWMVDGNSTHMTTAFIKEVKTR